MKKTVFKVSILLNLVLISCSDSKVEFKVFNNTKYILDSLMVSATGSNYLEKSKILRLEPNDSSSVFVNLSNVEKTDGNYLIEVNSNEIIKKRTFGYYSNGAPLSSVYEIHILQDTIQIKEVVR